MFCCLRPKDEPCVPCGLQEVQAPCAEPLATQIPERNRSGAAFSGWTAPSLTPWEPVVSLDASDGARCGSVTCWHWGYRLWLLPSCLPARPPTRHSAISTDLQEFRFHASAGGTPGEPLPSGPPFPPCSLRPHSLLPL